MNGRGARSWLLSVLLGLLSVQVPAQQMAQPSAEIDEACWEETFTEDFEKLRLQSADTSGIWSTSYIWPRDVIINNELQYYIDPHIHGESAFSLHQGVLSIVARQTPVKLQNAVQNQPYVSGVLTTQQNFSQRYGRFEIRAKLPAGRGLWPAFWLLPSFENWPEGVAILPEIDVMEFIGSELGTYHTTVHTNESGELKSYPYDHNELGDLTQAFHTYSVIWNKQSINWYFDGRHMVSHRTPDDLHEPMHFLINLAVGGHWAGKPDHATLFPARYQIEYVKAYRQAPDCSAN